MKTYCKLLVMVFFCFLFAGCASLLPSSKTTIISLWGDFDSAKSNYGKITPGQTTVEELNAIGFNPYTSAQYQDLECDGHDQHILVEPIDKNRESGPGRPKML